jgi:hypothetical protein
MYTKVLASDGSLTNYVALMCVEVGQPWHKERKKGRTMEK